MYSYKSKYQIEENTPNVDVDILCRKKLSVSKRDGKNSTRQEVNMKYLRDIWYLRTCSRCLTLSNHWEDNSLAPDPRVPNCQTSPTEADRVAKDTKRSKRYMRWKKSAGFCYLGTYVNLWRTALRSVHCVATAGHIEASDGDWEETKRRRLIEKDNWILIATCAGCNIVPESWC